MDHAGFAGVAAALSGVGIPAGSGLPVVLAAALQGPDVGSALPAFSGREHRRPPERSGRFRRARLFAHHKYRTVSFVSPGHRNGLLVCPHNESLTELVAVVVEPEGQVRG